MNTAFKYLFILITIAFLSSCAQINPLQGGVKDTYAPAIDSSGTYPLSGTINFTENEINLKFKEFIALNNPKDNIIITPQLEIKPTITSKNKKLKIVFNEKLDENTTYTISFNHAITDITEKNDSIFQYVFSTGNFIDSLSISGQITDGFTNKPNETFLVGLYKIDEEIEFDSIPIKNRPIYIAQTDKTGNFTMNYLKAEEYYIFAIEDKNKNLKLDPNEKLGFLKENKVNITTENPPISMLTFLPANSAVKITTTKFTYPGRIEFIFNNEPDSFQVSSTIDLLIENTEKKDSLVYWLTENPDSKMRFYSVLNGELDTLKPLYKGIPKTAETTGLTINNNLINGKLMPKESFHLVFSEPIEKIEKNSFHFTTKDSIEIEHQPFYIENLRTVAFDSLSAQIAFVKIDSGAANSIFGHTNQNTEWVPISILEPSYFGTLIITIDTVFETSVFIDLLDDKREVIRSIPFSQSIVFEDLLPGKYQLRLIFDENNDQKWTTGSLKELRLPEKVIYNESLINVKSKWEKEIDWIIEN